MRNRRARILLALTIPLSSAVIIHPASAVPEPSIFLCEAGNYGSLSKVLTKGDGAVIHYSPASLGDTTFIGAESSVEADAFLAGSNMTTQKSPADYIAAQGRLRLAIDSAKTNLLPYSHPLNEFSMHLESITGGSLGTYGPGIYSTVAAMNMAANETITLSGGPNDKFIFISGEALTFGANDIVRLQGGAQAKNVYWVIGTFVGAKTIGASSTIVGDILVDGSLTVGARTHINGRILVVNTVSYGAGSFLEVLPPETACGANTRQKSLFFTDTTLKDVTIGDFYSDTITAEAHTDNVLNNDPITYSVDIATPLPSGLNLDSLTGVVSGMVSADAVVGSSTYTFIVASPSYPSPTFPVTLNVKAKPSTPPILSITFTDKTLVSAVKGVPYSDTLTAVGMTGASASAPSPLVTYLVSTSHLPSSLLLNTSTGVVSGIPTTVETQTIVVTASSSGYLSQSETITIIVVAPLVVAPPVVTTPVVTTGSGGSTGGVVPALIAAPAIPPAAVAVTETSTALSDVVTLLVVADAVVLPGADLQNSNETGTAVIETKVVKKPINTLMMTALFANNSSQLDLKTKAAIKSMVIKMKKLNIATLTVAGFSSSAGGVDNVKLSVARAKSLATELVKNGVKNKITLKGLGVKPSANSLAALTLTRKAEIWVLLKA